MFNIFFFRYNIQNIIQQYSLIHISYAMCTFNSFFGKCFLQIFFIHHILIMVQDQHGFCTPNQALGKLLDCCLACISPRLMFVFLISLTSISQFQSKGPLLFNVTFFSAPDTWLKLAAWKSLNWNPVFKIFFDQTHYHHIYTNSMHVVFA